MRWGARGEKEEEKINTRRLRNSQFEGIYVQRVAKRNLTIELYYLNLHDSHYLEKVNLQNFKNYPFNIFLFHFTKERPKTKEINLKKNNIISMRYNKTYLNITLHHIIVFNDERKQRKEVATLIEARSSPSRRKFNIKMLSW